MINIPKEIKRSHTSATNIPSSYNSSMRTAHFLTPGKNLTLQDLKLSLLASVRIRLGVAATVLAERQWGVTIGDNPPSPINLLFIGKIGAASIEARAPIWIRAIEKAKASGAKIILDYTDHHLGFPSVMSPFYRDALPLVDVAVTPSSAMEKNLKDYWTGPINQIEDPFEVPILNPELINRSSNRLLWFGHRSNLQYLVNFISTESALSKTSKLLILTDSIGLQLLSTSKISNAWRQKIEMAEWSLSMMVSAARMCNGCIIPSDPKDPKKRGASSNRLITALALGLPTAADQLDSYTDFSDFFVDIRCEKAAHFFKNPAEYQKQVTEAQRTIIDQFTINSVSRKWAATIAAIS